MAEALLQYQRLVTGPDGTRYEARAFGAPIEGTMWEGWIEFMPVSGGEPLRSGRETTQPNRTDTEYWATGLSPVYLEGALWRALALDGSDAAAATLPDAPAIPAAPSDIAATERPVQSVLDPFSVYTKGEALLRAQLSALSPWHLVNIAHAYELSDEPAAALNERPAADLIETIVDGVRSRGGTMSR
ncbi:MAG TPA: hypothetical protein VKD69_05655 [Vicinamibacterales bacterium]|nr:hypothetical protein [Vicinamibacterales bacterium]